MITLEVNKFMALAPLMLPNLIDSKKCAEPDIAEDSAILYFSLLCQSQIGAKYVQSQYGVTTQQFCRRHIRYDI